MSYLLVTNDDGVESPAVIPLIAALADLGTVRSVFPDRERSWIGKAITRYDELEVATITREGHEIHTASGYPADCVQLGMHSLFEGRPSFVVSGINLGYNFGSAFVAGSGTIGAAAEAALAGIPAVALSAGMMKGEESFRAWRERVMQPAERPHWERIASIGADVVRSLRERGFPKGVDVISVNIPYDAGADTPRRVCRLAETRYDGLFRHNGEQRFVHAYRGELHRLGDAAGTDLEAADQGVISITPLRLPRGVPRAELDEAVLAGIERP